MQYNGWSSRRFWDIWVRISEDEHYEGVCSNVVSIRRRCECVKLPEKKRYVTLEWPLRQENVKFRNYGNSHFNQPYKLFTTLQYPVIRLCTIYTQYKQQTQISTIYSTKSMVIFILWDFVHFSCCGILSCGILSCGILSCGILSAGFCPVGFCPVGFYPGFRHTQFTVIKMYFIRT